LTGSGNFEAGKKIIVNAFRNIDGIGKYIVDVITSFFRVPVSFDSMNTYIGIGIFIRSPF